MCLDNMTERFIVNAHGPNPHAIAVALKHATIVAKAANVDVVIVVPRKDTASTTILNNVIPEALLKELLKKDVTLPLTDDISISLESAKTYSPYGFHGVLIALHSSEKSLAQIDASDQLEAIILVPWTEAEGDGWRTQWNPAEIPVETNGNEA